MSTKQKWLELAEQCKQATGPDRDIDARIELAIRPYLGAKPHAQPEIGKWLRMDGKPHIVLAGAYTGSLDAITALIERELPGWGWTAYSKTPSHRPLGVLVAPNYRDQYGVNAATPALALGAAFCQAMAGKAGT